MDLSGVIAELVEERGLDRDRVTDIVCQGIQSAYERKFPDRAFHVSVGSRSFSLAVEVEKKVATSLNSDFEISLRRAKVVNPKAKVGDIINVPFEESVGRVEVLLAKNIIAQGVKQLEQAAIYEEFHEKEGTLLTGTVHKKERAGYAVNIGDVVAFLPNS